MAIVIDTTTYDKTKVRRVLDGYGLFRIENGRLIAVNGGRRERPPKTLLIHTTNGNPRSTFESEARFLRDSSDVSAGYLVGSQNRVSQILPDDMPAWHSGDCVDNDYENPDSIGIEIHWSPALGPMPQSLKDTVNELCQLLLRRHPTITKVDTHRNQAIPKGRKVDPSGWSDADFYTWVRSLQAPTSQPGSDLRAYQLKNGYDYANIREGPSVTFPVALGGRARLYPGESVIIDAYGDWLHLADGRGFIAGSLLEPAPVEAVTLWGRPTATLEACLGYIFAHPHDNYSAFDIHAIVNEYYRLCATVDVNPVVPIAQMIHETANLTSWWSARPRRNPVGIGVTGEQRDDKPTVDAWQWDVRTRKWVRGVAFADWVKDSIPAHVGRMLAYALPIGAGTSAQQLLIAKALTYRTLPASYRGIASTLVGLSGTWATDTHYADRLVQIVKEIEAFHHV